MTSVEIRKRFIDFFVKKLAEEGAPHVEVHSSTLVPEQHPTLLFVNSGMVQFTPYFLGEKDPVDDFGSDKLCSVQKCIRTGDLDIVGISKYHLVFFEMLGSWSIGDYGKKKAVEYSFDLLTNKEYGFGFDPERFIPTVFGGNDESPCDIETVEAWKSVGIPEERISKLPAEENWWAPAGLTGPGPCGPCTEVLYDRGEEFGPEEEVPGMTDNPRYLEIWNAGVFMQYNRDDDGKLHELEKLSVDTGAGLERFAVLLQGVDSVYETDLFVPIIEKIKELAKESGRNIDLNSDVAQMSIRRSAEHIKSATFIMSENVHPSNKDQGYVVRRLIRTAFNDFVWVLGIDSSKLSELVPIVFDIYKDAYPELGDPQDVIEILNTEHDAYKKIADNSRRFIMKNISKPGFTAFDVYQSTGASRELILAIANEQSIDIDFTDFENQMKEHQERSREGAGEKFKGGLGDHSESTTKLHTATHLLHGALREVLGSDVQQMGSNITAERLRFDFSYSEKMTDEQKEEVQDIVNQKISEALPVNVETMSFEEAEKTGALHFFNEKYGESVKVYYIGESLDTAWSKEFCGGPHVENTSELGIFKIKKEESVGKGVRRIKATLG